MPDDDLCGETWCGCGQCPIPDGAWLNPALTEPPRFGKDHIVAWSIYDA